jgi:phage terminase large subunit-like protein
MVIQLPARYTPPLSENFVTDGDLLIDVAERFVYTKEQPDTPIELDEWQKWLLRAMLERYPDDYPDEARAGRLRYRQICVSLGRQNGKSTLAQLLAVYGLLMHEPGPTVIGLASSSDQARIIYERVLYSIRANPWLAKRFKKATEHRGIHLADGSGTYHVKAARDKAVQGITVSLGVVDELHIIPRGLYSALTLGASTRKDGLIVGITTAGDANSETLLELYNTGGKAILGDPDLERFGFFEWSAPENCDLFDHNAIKAANPAVACGRVPLDSVITDMKTIPEHEARRYRLNQFIAGVQASWLPGDFFARAIGDGIENIDGAVLGVDLTKNFGHATISAAKRVGERYQTELVASLTEPTEEQVANLILDLYRNNRIIGIALDDRFLHSLSRRLKNAGLPVWSLWSKEINTACATVYSMFANERVTHKNDPLLALQNPLGMTRYFGESWQISRKESLGDIDALLATVFALYVAATAEDGGVGVY